MQEWIVPGALVAVVLLALTLLLVVLRDRRRVAADLALTRAEAAELRERVESLAQPPPATDRAETSAEYVITEMGTGSRDGRSTRSSTIEECPTAGLERVDGRLFADLVLRESLVKAAAVAGGVRRALGPETRNRIRFEMRREVKRSRRQRRAELRAARRLLHQHQRTGIDLGSGDNAGEDAA
jgi:hypothetical protein